MKFNILKTSNPISSFNVEKIKGMYDLNESHYTQKFEGELPIEEMNWKIGVIVGNSGTGKSTIAESLFKIWKAEYKGVEVINEFDGIAVNDICKTFVNVGFSSPPSWLKAY